MPTDPELEQLVKEGRHMAAFKLLQQRRRAAQQKQPQRAPFDELLHDMRELRRRGTPVASVVALFFGSLLVVLVLVLALSFVGLGVSEWTLFPAVDRLMTAVMPLVFAPAVLSSLAAGVFVFGLVIAHRFRSPLFFMSGVTAFSFGLVCVWLFPVYIGLLQRRLPAEAELPLLIVGGVVTLLLLVVGIQLAAIARGRRPVRSDQNHPG